MFPGSEKYRFKLRLILLAGFFAGLSLNAYPGADTLWNQTDSQGKKQGWWKKSYPNGIVMYRGFFKDNYPEGKMIRYYEDGARKAVLNHSHRGMVTHADMYFRNGQLGASGKYIRQKRDSIWNYWSYYTGALSYKESYNMGLKEGASTKYYPEGGIAEIMWFSKDLKHGEWKQFYEDSTIRLESTHDEGSIHGPYKLYNRDRILIIEGNYIMGKQDGHWKFYDQEGSVERSLRYDMGELLDKEEYEAWMKQFMDKVDENIGKIPEPDFDNFFER